MTTRVIFGRLRLTPDGSAVRFEWRYTGAAVAELWSALTEPDRLSRWLAPVSGERAVGGTVRVDFGGGAVALVIVQQCRPERGLVLEWVFPDGLATPLRVEVSRDGDSAVLTLDHSGFPDSPAHYAAAWQVNLDQLGAELSGRAVVAEYGAEFEALVPHYAAAWRRLTEAQVGS
jgi:uncharacterized protein YndB with AHSA1/START domain